MTPLFTHLTPFTSKYNKEKVKLHQSANFRANNLHKHTKGTRYFVNVCFKDYVFETYAGNETAADTAYLQYYKWLHINH